MISTEPHWDPSEPIVGINPLRRWTPKLVIHTNKNRKSTVDHQIDEWTDILYCHLGYFPSIVFVPDHVGYT